MMRRISALLLSLILSCPSAAYSRDQSSLLFSSEETANESTTLQYKPRSTRQFFSDLPSHIGNDLKETFWNRWHFTFLVIGTGATLIVHQADNDIQQAFDPEDPLGVAGDVFNFIGTSHILGGAALTAFAVSKLAGAHKAALTSGTMLEALALTMAFTFTLKYATQRERPDGSNSLSFPSAHASGAFALATVTQVFHGPLYGIPSYALASMIAMSRLDANKHFASDTMAGALLGTLIGLGTAKFHKKEFKDLFIAPVAPNGAPGISFIHNF
jgi:membrane-associated phospholipid phosphatase